MPDTLYLDHNASTPVRAEVVEAMARALRDFGANPSSAHSAGQRVRAAIERAREQTAALVNARPDEVVFVSGGTEGDHLAIVGSAWAQRARGQHVAFAAIEHHAVHGAADVLERLGWHHSTLPSDANGSFNPNPSTSASTLSVTTSASTPTGNYTLTGASGRSDLRSDDGTETKADVSITASRSALVKFLTTHSPREPHTEGIEITGTASAVRKFLNLADSALVAARIASTALHNDPDVFSLDIDGNDYYVAQALFDAGLRPKILVVEYNSVFGPERSATIEYSENFDFTSAHPTQLYYGVSIAGWRACLSKRGYRFVTVERNGVNAFFVDAALFEADFLDGLKGLAFAENHYQLMKFRVPSEEQFSLISSMRFVPI